MSSAIKYKWLLALFVWGGCLFICFLNAATVNSILESREKKEILQKDIAFWKQNEANISGVIERQRLLSHNIESLKLGLLFLDDTFNKLAADYNLSELKMEMDTKQSIDGSMPVKTSFKSSLKNGLDTINKIQTEYVFIPFRSVKIEEENQEKYVKFNLLLDYKYCLTGMQ